MGLRLCVGFLEPRLKPRLDDRTLTETAEISAWLYDDTALAMLEGREEISTAG